LFQLSSTDLQVYFITNTQKSKENKNKFFILSKTIWNEQKMLKSNICEQKLHNFTEKTAENNACDEREQRNDDGGV